MGQPIADIIAADRGERQLEQVKKDQAELIGLDLPELPYEINEEISYCGPIFSSAV